MKRSFSDRLKAAEKALAAHLEARETHIMRHHALKERLKGIQDNSADPEELRTQNALGTLVDGRIRHLQFDMQRINRQLARLRSEKNATKLDAKAHSALMQIVDKWDIQEDMPADPARAKRPKQAAPEKDKPEPSLAELRQAQSVPEENLFMRCAVRSGAAAYLMVLFISVDLQAGDRPFHERLVWKQDAALVQLGKGADASGWNIDSIERTISQTTGLPPLREMLP